MHRRRTALCLALAVFPACGLIADIQPLRLASRASFQFLSFVQVVRARSYSAEGPWAQRAPIA